MRIAFSSRAGNDLQSIIEWYREVAPDSVERIQTDIIHRLDLIADHPFAGMQSANGKFRHIVTRRYRYRIAYRVETDRILIIGIFRHQNRTE